MIHIWLEGPLRVILFFHLLLSPSPWYWLGDGVKWLEGRRETFFPLLKNLQGNNNNYSYSLENTY